jgi:hypothetical protein
MVEIGVFNNNSFVAFGPRKELSFMKVSIDTYYKYNMLMVMIVMHTFITDFIADSLSPHVLNVVQDTKTKYIPHKPFTYYAITTIWAVYCSISQLFAIFIAFAQIDLLLVRMLSDIVANLVTTSLYLQFKTHDPIKFKRQEAQSMKRTALEENSNDSCEDEEVEGGGKNTMILHEPSSAISLDSFSDRDSLLQSPNKNAETPSCIIINTCPKT